MLNNEVVYNKANNIYQQIQKDNIKLETGINRIKDLLVDSDNDDALSIIQNWDDTTLIRPKDYYIKHLEAELPNDKNDEYKFDIKIGMPKKEAKEDAEHTHNLTKQELREAKSLNFRYLQYNCDTGHIEPASSRGLNAVIHNLRMNLVNNG